MPSRPANGDSAQPLIRIIDTNIILSSSEKVLFVDSDIYSRGKVSVPGNFPSILYPASDVPGYKGRPILPLIHPMVVGLNAGFILWNTEIFDIGFLNEICKRYLVQIEREFWTEQTAWSVLAARSDSRGVFDGRDVCNIGGLHKRTPAEVKANVTKWFGSNSPIEDPSIIEAMVEGTSVLHFPGVGKKWIENFATPREDADEVRTLRWEPVENANFLERGLLALRMAWSNRQ